MVVGLLDALLLLPLNPLDKWIRMRSLEYAKSEVCLIMCFILAFSQYSHTTHSAAYAAHDRTDST